MSPKLKLCVMTDGVELCKCVCCFQRPRHHLMPSGTAAVTVAHGATALGRPPFFCGRSAGGGNYGLAHLVRGRGSRRAELGQCGYHTRGRLDATSNTPTPTCHVVQQVMGSCTSSCGRESLVSDADWEWCQGARPGLIPSAIHSP